MALTLAFDNEPPGAAQVYPVEDGVVRLAARVPGPHVWSPETPALHRLRVTLAEGGEVGCAVRFGLRRIEARAGALWLNGERLILRGYNRHEWHPNSGPCTPVLQMVADLQLLRDLGCNFVRGSHYPQDQRFLDLCDELGFLVWEETSAGASARPCSRTQIPPRPRRDTARDGACQLQPSERDHLGFPQRGRHERGIFPTHF